jgi:hypothetical protein
MNLAYVIWNEGRGGLSSRLPTVGEVNLSHLLLI